MTTITPTPLPADPAASSRPLVVGVEEFDELVPLGRPGGQGRVYRPGRTPPSLTAAPVVVKLYRHEPSTAAAGLLAEMIAWSLALDERQSAHLHEVAAWPVAIVTREGRPAGIAMRDVTGRFEVPFVMPSGREQRVLLSLEHLLGSDDYLQLRGLGVRLDTRTRAAVAERIAGALAFLHRHGVVASDIAPNNLLVRFGVAGPDVCFIDCDSMVFHGRQALAPVETVDWQIPPEFSEAARTRATDAYKLGLVILRLFARSHDARLPAAGSVHVPVELRQLVARSLRPDAANRPPAGEWQRALRQLLTQGGLDERCPGPAPKAVRATAPRATTSHRREPPVAPTTSRRPSQRSQWPTGQRASRPRVSRALFAVAVVVFLLILARLVAAAAPYFGGGNEFAPPGGGQPNNYYYVPAEPGSGSGLR